MDELSRSTFDMVARSFSNLEHTLHQNSLAIHITSYDGTDPSLCRHWIDKIEKGESLSVFLERLHALSLDAFQEINLEEEGANKLSQRQLVNVFIDGPQNDRIKRKILARECQDLNTAARIAKKELGIERKMNLRVPHQLPE